MRFIHVNEVASGRMFPRYLNPDTVHMLMPGVTRTLNIDGHDIQVRTTIVHFTNTTNPMLVAGAYDEVAARLSGEDMT